MYNIILCTLYYNYVPYIAVSTCVNSQYHSHFIFPFLLFPPLSCKPQYNIILFLTNFSHSQTFLILYLHVAPSPELLSSNLPGILGLSPNTSTTHNYITPQYILQALVILSIHSTHTSPTTAAYIHAADGQYYASSIILFP